MSAEARSQFAFICRTLAEKTSDLADKAPGDPDRGAILVAQAILAANADIVHMLDLCTSDILAALEDRE